MSVNGEMLSNMISAQVNSMYKDTPPTEEEFIALANTTREATTTMLPIDDEEFQHIMTALHAQLVIMMDVGVFINDRNTTHQSWLPARRAETDFFFWGRYKRYLEEVKHWNPRVTATLDKVSDEILDLLGDPLSEENFQVRGLALGDVQSGKTANYTAIVNKAADTGYRVIIVLAGMMENLRQQTQGRLDAECSGRKSEYFLDPHAGADIKNTPVGVGRYKGSGHRIASFTSVSKDFDVNILRSAGLSLQGMTDPVLLVVKKNKKILTNLTRWLMNNNKDETTGLIQLPMLLIDDEADNASVNTRSEEDSPAAINGCIRKLLKSFSQASYLGITATPFANIFIDPETDDDMAGDDLFPRDFIYALEPPTNYIGTNSIFGDDAPYQNALVALKPEEMDRFFPFTHKKSLQVTTLPSSMTEAIAYFLLVNAIRDYRGDNAQHRSMMIHVSRFTDVQNRLAAAVMEWLVALRNDVQSYHKLEKKDAMKIASIAFLATIWDKYRLECIAGMSWDTCLKKYLYKAIAPIDVRAVNQKTGATSLDYYAHKDDGLRVIAVGGNSLSRGITLEGSIVTYFYRRSQMYDTLLQMGRWFGYRPNYEDLFKIWISEDAIDWYGYITRATDELKLEIAKMKNANQTPLEFGLKVRQDPGYALLVTARNKMRNATVVTRPVSVVGRLLETPRLKIGKQVLDNNAHVFKAFVEQLDTIGQPTTIQDACYFWRGVSKEEVAQLLLDFETCPWHLSFNGRGLAEYIAQKMDDTPWDVALCYSGNGDGLPGGLKCGERTLSIPHTEEREVSVDETSIKISGTKVRVGSGGCTRIGLTNAEREEARETYAKLRKAAGKSVSSMPDSAYLLPGRKPILMLHVLSVKNRGDRPLPKFLYALGVGFPAVEGNAKTLTATYMVNLVELRNWIDVDEEDE